MSWKSAKVQMMERREAIRTTPLIEGIVTWRNRCQTLAPSIAAASCSSWGTACSPARIVIPKKGTPRQMLAQQTEAIANTGSPRKLIFLLIKPKFLKSQLIGLKTGSKIMNQPRELSAVGTIQGIITAE